MLLSAPLIIPPYEIMQLQTSIRSCEGNHYVVTVINDAAENSGLLSNNPCAQGAFEGRGPVAKETDDIQNGPRSTVLLLFLFFFFSLLTNRFFVFLSLLLLSRNQLPRDLWRWRFFLRGGFGFESFVLFVRRRSIRVCVHIDLIKQPRYWHVISDICVFPV